MIIPACFRNRKILYTFIHNLWRYCEKALQAKIRGFKNKRVYCKPIDRTLPTIPELWKLMVYRLKKTSQI